MKPEEKARREIDRKLKLADWSVQDKEQVNLSVSLGVAVREFPTSSGPADYLLFIDGSPVGVIEAKPSDAAGGLTSVEQQSNRYIHSTLIGIPTGYRLRFAYEATDKLTRFTDLDDIKTRSRTVFSFHRPETLQLLLNKGSSTIRNNLKRFPELNTAGFRVCQIKAITGLETSFAENRPRALIQMATGAGKTFTAISAVYRLLKYGKFKRILFLVDTRSLGAQAEQAFMAYKPNEDPRSFSTIYGVTRLHSPTLPQDSSVYVSTIQRMYSILRGVPIPDEEEEHSDPGQDTRPREVQYNGKVPPEFFDCIIVDECHRSIYNIWSQVLEYFDAFIVGLTATPDSRTLGYFNQNLVSEYTRQDAILDNVNVPEEIFLIETDITKHGATVLKGNTVAYRERYTRAKQWYRLEDNLTYPPSVLNGEVVNPSQVRTIIRTFKENVFSTLFPDRKEVPKTLIFAKDDSHADDIVQIVREEFGEGNNFCCKITYRADNAEALLSSFRNSYEPRIAVTVDMIATGTDVKPLECLIFMRDVRSKNYYEQMVGRGTRTLSIDELRLVSPSAQGDKDHFVIVDAVGVTTSPKTETFQLEYRRGISLKELMERIAAGDYTEQTLSSTASRLLLLARKMLPPDRTAFSHLVGCSIGEQVRRMLVAFNNTEDDTEDLLMAAEKDHQAEEEEAPAEEQEDLLSLAVLPFHDAQVRELILQIQRTHRQLIDSENLDSTLFSGWNEERDGKAADMLRSFRQWIEENRDELTALGIIYATPYKLRHDALDTLSALAARLRALGMTPDKLRHCYDIRDSKQRSPHTRIADLVSLIRYELGLIPELSPFADRVRANYKDWIFARNAGNNQFSNEQNEWLQLIRDHIATSLSITKEHLDLTPFGNMGGLAKFYQIFGKDYLNLLEELNIYLVA